METIRFLEKIRALIRSKGEQKILKILSKEQYLSIKISTFMTSILSFVLSIDFLFSTHKPEVLEYPGLLIVLSPTYLILSPKILHNHFEMCVSFWNTAFFIYYDDRNFGDSTDFSPNKVPT